MRIASNIPCNGCQSRTQTCHGKCERYLEYRSARIEMLECRKKQNAADEADVLRGDKIRRDVRQRGLLAGGGNNAGENRRSSGHGLCN